MNPQLPKNKKFEKGFQFVCLQNVDKNKRYPVNSIKIRKELKEEKVQLDAAIRISKESDDAVSYWTRRVEKFLLGQKIVKVEYMSEEDAEDMDWVNRPIQIRLSNGIWLTPTQDDEGNDGGSISTNTTDIIPTL